MTTIVLRTGAEQSLSVDRARNGNINQLAPKLVSCKVGMMEYNKHHEPIICHVAITGNPYAIHAARMFVSSMHYHTCTNDTDYIIDMCTYVNNKLKEMKDTLVSQAFISTYKGIIVINDKPFYFDNYHVVHPIEHNLYLGTGGGYMRVAYDVLSECKINISTKYLFEITSRHDPKTSKEFDTVEY